MVDEFEVNCLAPQRLWGYPIIMNANETYYRVYRELNRCTPLKFDCGKLCNQACCRGTEENGMWLFPGEEELFEEVTAFKIRPTGRELPGGRTLKWLVCQGVCSRMMRPLSCRIFPLTPFLNDKGFVMVDVDPRAKSICPLAKGKDFLQPEFVRTVAWVCRELAKEPDILEYYRVLTAEIQEYRDVAGIFLT